MSAPIYCSFCGKAEYEVETLIAGPTVWAIIDLVKRERAGVAA